MEETATISKNSHGPNVRRWREWRGKKQEVLAEEIGVSQATMSGYEKKDKLDADILAKIAKALDIPVEAITELGDDAAINIVANNFHDSSSALQYKCSFNPIDKIIELYEKLLLAEKEKVSLLQEVLKDKK